MRCFVSGASGFIGANLVHELAAQGHEVQALVRPGSDRRGLAGASFETVEGDLHDRDRLEAAMRDCDWCFHVAASYRLWLPDYRPMYATNVEGTRNVIEAAQAAGCSRIVYTSTVGCIGWREPINGEIAPADELTAVSEAQMICHYKRSKWLAERIALDLAARGAPVVIVNPSAPVGPRDAKPTPTGGFLLDFLKGRMPAYLDTGLNWVPVHDVAVGHIRAAERGRVGERYILGHAEGNWTMQQSLRVMGELAGRSPPRVRLPYGVALATGFVCELVARVTGRPPRAPLAGVRIARHRMFINPAKAIRELGLPQSSLTDSFRAAFDWFRANGYLTRRP
jgi:dihydroflavonol-4-reductase